MQRGAFDRAKWIRGVEPQFHARVELAQQRTEAPAGEEIRVRGLEHVPRRREMIPEIAEEFAVGDGHDQLSRRDPPDLREKRPRLLDVLQHLETKRRVERTVREGQRASVHLPVRQTKPSELGAIRRIHLRAHPVIAVRQQAAAVGTESAADVDNPLGRRA